MTSSDMIHNHHFNGIDCSKFIDSLMNFPSHFFSVFFTCSIGICTHFAYFIIPVTDFQCITLFTFKVNYILP